MFKSKTLLLLILFFLISSCFGENESSSPPIDTANGYPKLAMWWPSSWEQDPTNLARYDYIGWGRTEKEEVLTQLKQLNPSQKHFTSISLTEVGHYSWQYQPELVSQIPAEWFLTQAGTELTSDIDPTQTTLSVIRTTDSKGNPLFEETDTLVCEYESMKVVSINHSANTIEVERGFLRPSSSHSSTTRIAAHITFWPGSWVMNISTLCPEVDIGHGKQKWFEWAVEQADPDNMRDGYIIDRIENGQSWLVGKVCRNIDPDCSNVVLSDYTAFDNAWYNGIRTFLPMIRSKLNGRPFIANTNGTFKDLLNGSICESCPGNWTDEREETYEDWYDRIMADDGYVKNSRTGYTPNYSMVETYESEDSPDPNGDGSYDNPFEKPDFVPNYQRMRWGLTSALLGDGYFSYEINTNGHGSLGLMWFDEYDNAGQNRRYLGTPLDDAYVVQDFGDVSGRVYRRNFQSGIVICNPSDRTVTVSLEKEYKKIKGTQVPEINSGETVSSVTISSHDGIILLRQ